MQNYYFDTYALVEITKGNPNYIRYKNIGIVTTKLNLMELYYSSLREYGKEIANQHYNRFLSDIQEVTDEDIKEAMQFKVKHKKENLSYIDCVGYIIAKRYKIKFLTGDNKFEHKENVEWVR